MNKHSQFQAAFDKCADAELTDEVFGTVEEFVHHMFQNIKQKYINAIR